MSYNIYIMVEINVDIDLESKKILNYLQSKYNKVPKSALYKALRNKDIRVNGIRINENIDIFPGDVITLYIKDDILNGINKEFLLNKSAIIYDDDNIVIVNKPTNILVQSTDEEAGLDKTLSDLYSERIIPCHRLDRNTSGLVIFAKDKESEKILLDMIKNNNIKKYYKCTVYGHPKVKSATLHSYLFKDSKNSIVIISDIKKRGYVEIITKYSVLKYNSDNTSILEVELITGKTHQIRAHLAHIGYPIIGDGKYGINKINKIFKKKYQELSSYKLEFIKAYGKLSYLNEKTFSC